LKEKLGQAQGISEGLQKKLLKKKGLIQRLKCFSLVLITII